MTTTHYLNETPLDRELRFLDRHIDRLERWKTIYEILQSQLQDDETDEDRRRQIHDDMTKIEIDLVLLEACYDRKAKLEQMS